MRSINRTVHPSPPHTEYGNVHSQNQSRHPAPNRERRKVPRLRATLLMRCRYLRELKLLPKLGRTKGKHGPSESIISFSPALPPPLSIPFQARESLHLTLKEFQLNKTPQFTQTPDEYGKRKADTGERPACAEQPERKETEERATGTQV
jgi:hypothetical protein